MFTTFLTNKSKEAFKDRKHSHKSNIATNLLSAHGYLLSNLSKNKSYNMAEKTPVKDQSNAEFNIFKSEVDQKDIDVPLKQDPFNLLDLNDDLFGFHANPKDVKMSYKNVEDTTQEDHRHTATDYPSPRHQIRKKMEVGTETGDKTTQLPINCSPHYNNYL